MKVCVCSKCGQAIPPYTCPACGNMFHADERHIPHGEHCKRMQEMRKKFEAMAYETQIVKV